MTEQRITEDRLLKRVRDLIAKAESTEHEAEAEALHAKASELIVKYAIDQAMLDKSRPADQRVKPESIYIQTASGGNKLYREILDLAGYVADHCRCKAVFHGTRSEGRRATGVTLVGYPADLRYFEMLFTSLHLQLVSRLEPKVDPSKSFGENVFVLRSAGVKWARIARLANEEYSRRVSEVNIRHSGSVDDRDNAAFKAEHAKLQKEWPYVPIRPDGQFPILASRRKAYCKKNGIDITEQRMTSADAYQKEFAHAYGLRIWRRLFDLSVRQETDLGVGTALALRTEALDEKLQELFPSDLKPIKDRKKTKYNERARAAGQKAADEADLGQKRANSGDRLALS